MVTPRDNFSIAVANTARDLVSGICSNPTCEVFTISAKSFGTGGTTNVGTAAHIHAAAPRGKRYDESQTREERRGIANAIWLCANCGRLIDSDDAAYPPSLLRQWKSAAEQRARDWVGKRATTVDEVNSEERLRVTSQLNTLALQFGAGGQTLQAAFTRPVDLRPPPLVATAITRGEVVARMLASVAPRRWLAIYGDVAVGKTHLAALLSSSRRIDLNSRAQRGCTRSGRADRRSHFTLRSQVPAHRGDR